MFIIDIQLKGFVLRTISRDIEAICKAGIPIITAQVAKGGISGFGQPFHGECPIASL